MLKRRLLSERLPHRSAVDQFTALLVCALALASLQAAIRSGAALSLLFAIHELIIVALVCCQRPDRATPRDGRSALIANTLAWSGVALPLLLRPGIPTPALVYTIGGLLQLGGGVLAPIATLTLGRSFGVIAAHRGIRTCGLYRIVRHPIYLAYLITNSGFVLAYPQRTNVVVLVLWGLIQAYRAVVEEQVLSIDTTYQAYMRRVRYRLLPGIW